MEECLDLPAAELRTATTALARVMRPLAHQLCNDLAYVTSTCDLALMTVTDAEATTLLQGAASYVQGVCDSLRGFSRLLQTPAAPAQAVSLGALVALAREKGAPPTAPELSGAETAVVCAAEDVALGLAALLANAAEAGAAHIGVRAWAEGAHYVLQVRDDGRGFPAGRLAELFGAFLSTKSPPHRGLGLNVVSAVVARLGGDLSLVTSAEGTTVSIRWPI